jgi:hypothetical protein
MKTCHYYPDRETPPSASARTFSGKHDGKPITVRLEPFPAANELSTEAAAFLKVSDAFIFLLKAKVIVAAEAPPPKAEPKAEEEPGKTKGGK